MGNRTADERGEPALLEGVDAVSRHIGDFVGEIHLVLLGELFQLRLVAEQCPQGSFGLLWRERSSARVERQIALDAIERRGPSLEVEVRPLLLNEVTQRRLDVEHAT